MVLEIILTVICILVSARMKRIYCVTVYDIFIYPLCLSNFEEHNIIHTMYRCNSVHILYYTGGQQKGHGGGRWERTAAYNRIFDMLF